MLEVAPAAYINIAANEAEKRANIKLIHISSVGRFGRMWMCGSESEMLTAQMAAIVDHRGYWTAGKDRPADRWCFIRWAFTGTPTVAQEGCRA